MSRIALGAPSTQWYEQGHTEPNHPAAWEIKEERKHKERTVVAKKMLFGWIRSGQTEKFLARGHDAQTEPREHS